MNLSGPQEDQCERMRRNTERTDSERTGSPFFLSAFTVHNGFLFSPSPYVTPYVTPKGHVCGSHKPHTGVSPPRHTLGPCEMRLRPLFKHFFGPIVCLVFFCKCTLASFHILPFNFFWITKDDGFTSLVLYCSRLFFIKTSSLNALRILSRSYIFSHVLFCIPSIISNCLCCCILSGRIFAYMVSAARERVKNSLLANFSCVEYGCSI